MKTNDINLLELRDATLAHDIDKTRMRISQHGHATLDDAISNVRVRQMEKPPAAPDHRRFEVALALLTGMASACKINYADPDADFVRCWENAEKFLRFGRLSIDAASAPLSAEE